MNPSTSDAQDNTAAVPNVGDVVAPQSIIVGVGEPRNNLTPSTYATPEAPAPGSAPDVPATDDEIPPPEGLLPEEPAPAAPAPIPAPAAPIQSPLVTPNEPQPAAAVPPQTQFQPQINVPQPMYVSGGGLDPLSPVHNLNPAAAAPVAGAAPRPAGPRAKTNPNSTQNTLQIAEVRDGIVIMGDGSFRSVVMVKSINFDLMSPQEQEAVEFSYQGFLNSLYFPIQIFLRSRKVDLRPYIEKLDKIRNEHDNMLLALLMDDYVQFMDELSQQTNIMDKNFYVVIPYFPVVETQKILTQNKNFLSGITKLFDRSEQHVVINEADLENAKDELRNRVQSVLSGLQQCGVQGLPLDTQELIELYYDTYNPDTATRQQLKQVDSLSADVVTKGVGTASQAHLQRELH